MMMCAACGGCGNPIKTRAVLALNQQWHEDCFKCFKCGEKLTGMSLPLL